MGCCFCCLSEGDKVGRVLEKFPPSPVSQAQDGQLQKLVGRVVLAGQNPFYSPGSGNPCVWYKVVVQEERVSWRNDANGQRQRHLEWVTIATDEKFVDFYLQDGVSKCFVNGSQRGQVRIQGNTRHGGGRNCFFSMPPPGIQQLIAQSCSGWIGWGPHERRTGRFQFTEQSFDVNELVAALGVVTPAQDPYTGTPVKILSPISSQAISEDFQTQNNWSDWDKRSWQDLVRSPAVLLSDSRDFTGTVQVAPAVNLPQYMLVNAYAGGMAAPMMGAPMMGMPPMMAPPMMGVQPMMGQQPMMGAPMAYAPGMVNDNMRQPLLQGAPPTYQ